MNETTPADQDSVAPNDVLEPSSVGGTGLASTDEPLTNRGASTGEHRLLGVLERYGLVIIFGLLCLYFWLFTDAGDIFMSSGNLQVVLLANSVKVCLALSFLVPLLCGQFNLAVGFMLAASALIAAKLSVLWGWPILLAALLAVVLLTVAGAFIGVLVAKFEIHSLIASLGVGTIVEGSLLRISGGTVVLLPPEHGLSGLRDWPWPIVYALVLSAICWYVLEHTPFGRRLHAVGSNAPAARLSGIPVKRMVILSFAISGLLAGLAGVLQMARDSGGNPQNGPGLLLPVFAAVFLSATVFKRTFNVWGSVVAVIGLALIVSGLSLNGAKPYVEDWFNGAALLIAVAFTAYVGRLRGRRMFL